jgi:ankyrin repeat protein
MNNTDQHLANLRRSAAYHRYILACAQGDMCAAEETISQLSAQLSAQLSDIQISHGLVEAAVYGHLNIVQYILSRVKDCDTLTCHEALQHAASRGHLEIVEALRVINVRPDSGIMRTAARNGHADVVNELLQKGCIDSGALSAACAGDHLAVVKVLEQRCGIQEVLVSAASRGNIRIVRYAISAGADATSAQPLYEAATNGHVEVIRELITAGASPNNRGALRLAISRGYIDVVRELVAHTGDAPYALIHAAESGKLDIVKALIRPDTDFDSLKTYYIKINDFIREYKKTLC